ncbi:hypothetical protein ACFQU8_08165 [Lentibacillus kimchii]|uniref:ABC transporter permease n=1 Tax=Lentibacillus kimchii TaxID=1542911 RepID=A0ABW2UTQ9_9BACI
MSNWVWGGISTILRSFEYFKIFNKEIFYNKISYIWSLGAPIIFLIINDFNERTNMTYEAFSYDVLFYWSYIILITGIQGIGIDLLFMRDQNFLKMYTYITGSKFPIILGRILSQCLFLWVNLILFTVFIGLFQEQPIASLLVTSLLILIPVVIPIYFFIVLIAAMPIRSNSIGPILTFIVLFLVSLIGLKIDTGTVMDYFVYLNDFLNPAQVIVTSAESIHSMLSGAGSILIGFSVLPLAVYLLVGSISCQEMSIISKKGR